MSELNLDLMNDENSYFKANDYGVSTQEQLGVSPTVRAADQDFVFQQVRIPLSANNRQKHAQNFSQAQNF